MLKRLKERKGFTLVELIVVLVILAILAALLIPALTGYINKAKQKQYVAECRSVVMAAQTLVDEVIAVNDVEAVQFTNTSTGILADNPKVYNINRDELKELIEISDDLVYVIPRVQLADKFKVLDVTLEDASGNVKCYYDGKKYIP